MDPVLYPELLVVIGLALVILVVRLVDGALQRKAQRRLDGYLNVRQRQLDATNLARPFSEPAVKGLSDETRHQGDRRAHVAGLRRPRVE